jgi:hypothetical protein
VTWIFVLIGVVFVLAALDLFLAARATRRRRAEWIAFMESLRDARRMGPPVQWEFAWSPDDPEEPLLV